MATPRYMHVPGSGWVDTRPEEWQPAICNPGRLPVYVVGDPEVERERVSARVAERMRVEPPWPGYPAWPAPVVSCLVVPEGQWPSVVARRVGALEVANWRAVVTYARGTTFDAQRRPGGVVDSWAIRTRHQFDLRRAVALWVGDGKLSSAGVLRFGDAPLRWITITDFAKELSNV
jgi:hypothetical protein